MWVWRCGCEDANQSKQELCGGLAWLTVGVVAREGESLAAGDDDVQAGDVVGHMEQRVR